MAKIKGNKLLPLIVGGVIVIGIIVVIIANKGKKQESSSGRDEIVEIADLSDDDLAVLGIAGDTEKDTVQTLITLVKAVRKEQTDIKDEIKKLKSENEQLKKGVGQHKINPVNKNANGTNSNEPSALEQQVAVLSDQLNKLASKLPTSSSDNSSVNNSASMPIGKGKVSSHQGNMADAAIDEVLWVAPSDQIVIYSKNKNNAGFQFPTSFNGNDPIHSKLKEHKDNINQPIYEKNGKDREPVYTLPVNSTLTGSVSMTALLGRIPIDGVVSDPYPFKAVIGRDNLIANGIELPHVEGAIVSGTASGDYVLSCVRGTVNSITFVFDDGRITTIPEQKNNSSNAKGDIGWLSDEYGIPCISGEIKSNAAQYLASVIGLGTAAAAADAMAQQNTTVVTDGGNVTNAVTGNNSQYVLGKGLSGGINQTIDWFNKRYGQTFDAVYVPPGQEIAIHITTELAIDYLFNGRLVDYEVNTKKLGVLD
ncbi:integrating conjugative element protein [Gilliamella sp. wkB18]|uniref:TIGR03752 family integrating conjugative element protein n=1 Tax=Gilliamella sp. wkB18 TaxID=3120260 RepID=UPI00080EBDA3|nr:TIGR03752 family integrating conjugative element protein [Gilliamella apicola]OCG64110.1 integrating conjugative element protein [Gilliamella apicola]